MSFCSSSERRICWRSVGRTVSGSNESPRVTFPRQILRFRLSSEELHFEVKTLSVASGELGIGSAIQSSGHAFDSAIAQSAKRGVGVGTSWVSPFGVGANIPKVADVLLEKIRQNVKIAQYKNPNTLLVVDLGMLQPVPGGKNALKRCWPDPHVEDAEVSGVLWMAAFGQPTTEIYDFADFEGKPNTAGLFGKQGILVDPSFAEIKGIIFVSHPWGVPSSVWALLRSGEMTYSGKTSMKDLLTQLVQGHWNDELNSNAHAF